MILRQPFCGKLLHWQDERVDLPLQHHLLLMQLCYHLLKRQRIVTGDDHQVNIAHLPRLAAGKGAENKGDGDRRFEIAQRILKCICEPHGSNDNLLERFVNRRVGICAIEPILLFTHDAARNQLRQVTLFILPYCLKTICVSNAHSITLQA